MTTTASPRHPFKALVAVAAMFAIAHGVCAHADTRGDAASHVNIVGQLPLHQACPDVDDDDLADALSTAWDDADKPSAVAVSFSVDHHHVFDVAPETGSPRVYHQIRRVVHALDCDSGDGAPHTVRFVVRFVDGDRDGPRVAQISDVSDDWTQR